ncbi:MAG TPA: hypothetical protein VHW68_06075 [Actinomycetota bacterium]|nr:hypothetical protein [Actinomycetota bacterium]
MRFLVVARPRDQIPPEQVAMLAEASKQWFDQYQSKLVSFGNFAGGGGYGIFDADSEEQLWRAIWEMPFIPFSNVTVDVVWDGKAGFDLFSDVVQKMMSQMQSGMD